MLTKTGGELKGNCALSAVVRKCWEKHVWFVKPGGLVLVRMCSILATTPTCHIAIHTDSIIALLCYSVTDMI